MTGLVIAEGASRCRGRSDVRPNIWLVRACQCDLQLHDACSGRLASLKQPAAVDLVAAAAAYAAAWSANLGILSGPCFAFRCSTR
jgi:hypothetical protein